MVTCTKVAIAFTMSPVPFTCSSYDMSDCTFHAYYPTQPIITIKSTY